LLYNRGKCLVILLPPIEKLLMPYIKLAFVRSWDRILL
jgi:hypothetical protein